MIEWSGDSVEEINKKLIEYYGLDIGLGIPKFRLVWSNSQRETRYGEFEVYNESGDLFLREEKGIQKDVEKYPANPDQWILEQICSTVGNPYLEMVTAWSYEPIWAFGAGNSDHRPIWRAIRLLVQARLFGDPNSVKKSPAQLMREEEEKMEKERILFKDMLKSESREWSYPVAVPHNYEKGMQNEVKD